MAGLSSLAAPATPERAVPSPPPWPIESLGPAPRPLVAIQEPGQAGFLLGLGDALGKREPGHGRAIGLLKLKPDRDRPESGLRDDFVRAVAASPELAASLRRLPLEVRATFDPARSIKEVLREAAYSPLVMALPDQGRAGAAGFRRLLADPPSDLLLARPGRRARIRSILLATRGGPDSRTLLRFGCFLAESLKVGLNVLHVSDPDRNPGRRWREDENFRLSLEGIQHPNLTVTEIASPNPLAQLQLKAAAHDLLMLGSHAPGIPSRPLVQPQIWDLVASLKTAVVVVKRAGGGGSRSPGR